MDVGIAMGRILIGCGDANQGECMRRIGGGRITDQLYKLWKGMLCVSLSITVMIRLIVKK